MYVFFLELVQTFIVFKQAWTLATAFLKPYDLNDPTARPRQGDLIYLPSFPLRNTEVVFQ